MRVLLMLHSEFDPGERSQVLDWIDRFSRKTEALGHEVRRFDPRTDRLGDFDWIHAFWRAEAETWASIRKAGLRLSVTPSLSDKIPTRTSILEHGLRLGRGLVQRKWPPIDEAHFRRLAERYFVIDEKWGDYLCSSWKVEERRVQFMGRDPEIAAGKFAAFLAQRSRP